MMEFILYAGAVNTLLAFKLWWDYRAKNKGKIINHTGSVFRDGVFYITSAYFIFCYPVFCSFWLLFGIILISAGYRWVMFDLLFNRLNGWRWNHYGRSSKLDKWLTKLGKYHLIPKFALIIIGLISLYVF